MDYLKNSYIYFFAILLAVLINILSWQQPFFWDTILTSTITQHFYEHGFQNLISPNYYDAGHPPLFYLYVTMFYQIFGKNLFAAHLSMLPFTILGIVCFIILMQYFSFTIKQQINGVLLFFAIPAVITQNSLVSYDAVLLSLYLAALAAILKQKKFLFTFISIIIVGISLRGLFYLTALSLTIYFLKDRNFKKWLIWNFYFIPALLIIAAWYYYHYTQTGWWISTTADGWSNHRGFVNIKGLFKNSISVFRCFFDVGIFILTFCSLFYVIKNKKIDSYTFLFLIPLLVFSISFLPFTNPINHRYFIIVYVLMLLPVLQLLNSKHYLFTILTATILCFGHFQIYPVPISNAWDCTLTHRIYTNIRASYFGLLKEKYNLDLSKTGTVFPLNASRKQTEMYNDTIRMINVNGLSLDSLEFVLFSNIGNDFSDEQIKVLKSWKLQQAYTKGQIHLILYKNPHYSTK